MRLGGRIKLSATEQIADSILLAMKNNSIQQGIINSATYAPSMHFFKVKSLIEADPIFNIIKQMPKGGVLHVHNSASVSSQWVIKNLTYRDDVKLCEAANGQKIFVTM